MYLFGLYGELLEIGLDDCGRVPMCVAEHLDGGGARGGGQVGVEEGGDDAGRRLPRVAQGNVWGQVPPVTARLQ
jgi:hypothetical protein